MKVAFVHDWLLNIGGAEKVFFDLVSKYMDQNQGCEYMIFTAISDKEQININGKNLKIVSAISNPFLINKLDYRNLMPFFPYIMKIVSKNIKKYNPQKVIISSFAIAKNIDLDGIYSILYLHSPMQYIYDSYDEYLDKFGFFKRQIFKIVSHYLRAWDKRFCSFDEVYSNSFYTSSLAKAIYDINSKVLYPPVDKEIIETLPCTVPKDYFVYIGRLVKFSKNVDIIIKLFNETKENLIIAGIGPDENYLKAMAGPNIIFIGQIGLNDKIDILKNSRGFINITKESFGIATAEALALGVPVFGYNAGATPQLVDNKSGYLVDKKDIKDLIKGFEVFKNTNYDRNYIKTNFLENYLKYVNY